MSAEELKEVLDAEIERLGLSDWIVEYIYDDTLYLIWEGAIDEKYPKDPWIDLGGDQLVMAAVSAGAELVDTENDEECWATLRVNPETSADSKEKING